MSVTYSIVCGTCGSASVVTASSRPAHGLELAKDAVIAGMRAYHDPIYGRMLIFCDDACADRQRTKKGHFRLRLKPEFKS